MIVSIIAAVLVGMTVHEFAHNYVGYLMGDPTPAREGRLTLNPMVHINWFGFLMFVLIGFGVLGSAPISSYRMRNPRWGYLAAVAAGPFSNLLLAVTAAILYRIIAPMSLTRGFLPEFLIVMVYFNVLLFLFNLIPVFPLDGWHIVLALLPPDLARTWQSWQQYTYYAFFFLILLSFVGGSFNILGVLIGGPIRQIMNILIG
jgi:Zn-dependent protease